jgi:hypothetical protein
MALLSLPDLRQDCVDVRHAQFRERKALLAKIFERGTQEIKSVSIDD